MKFALAGIVLAMIALAPASLAAGAPAAPVTPAAPAATVVPVEPAPPPKSIFVIDLATVKDPFYPNSKRWKDLIPKTKAVVVIEQPLFPDEIRCQGFSGGSEKRLAIVNNKTIEKGEKWEITLKSGQRVQVHCLDVKEKSVTLEVNGITKDLGLRASFQ